MPNLTTTIGIVKGCKIRQASWEAVCKTAGSDDLDTEITLLQILDNNGIEDAVLALRCWPEELSLYHFRADVADLVSHIYRDKYYDDTRVDDCIAMTRRYADGDATLYELEMARECAWAAAWEKAARAAAWAAETDAEAAEAVVMAAVTAAWEKAARAAAWAAKTDAAAAAMGGVDTYEKIEKLLRNYIAREY